MALFHVATIVPTKEALIADWLPRQPWGPPPGSDVEVLGAFRFDDPEGQVGMETFLASSAGALFQVGLTYRDAPLPGGHEALIVEMEHSALGTRWVYDGMRDATYLTSLAATSMTGQGEALGMAEYEGRWYIAPAKVRISGGGWGRERVAVDGFTPVSGADPDARGEATATFRNDRFELRVHRRPTPGARPPIGLVASWSGHPDTVVLTEVRQLAS